MNLHLGWVIISSIRKNSGLYWNAGCEERGSPRKEILGQNFFEKDGMEEAQETY